MDLHDVPGASEEDLVKAHLAELIAARNIALL